MTIQESILDMVPFINPATGEQFGEVAMATDAEIDLVRREMKAAFQIWRRKPLKERVRILRQLQTLIIDSVDEISAVINQDTGKSRQDGLIEVTMTVDRMHQYYKNAEKWLSRRRVPPGLYIFKKYYTEPHPYGTVGIIGPWNYPFDLCMTPVCSALLAGNTVILKPSEVAPAVGVMMEKLFKQVPELSPFVRVIHGDGRVGAKLVDSQPELVFLTGSTATGRKIAQKTAETLTPFLYELGGKDPMIVLKNANIRAAAHWGAWGAFYNTGQTCMGIERAYVEEAVYDQFLRELVAESKKTKIGYSPEIKNNFHTGPLTFERQMRIVENHLEDALSKGARILLGGRRDGLFMEPTIVVDVDHSMKIMQEETFGPILPVMKVQDEAHALQLANDSDFGLSACVWSDDMRQAKRVAHRLEVGSVNVNDAISHYPVSLLPFGGVKKSGNARTHGKGEVLQFTHYRSYAIGKPPRSYDLATKMREPNNYRLGKMVIQMVFGENLRQRTQPIRDVFTDEETAPQAKTVTAVAMGATAVVVTLALRLFRKK